MATPLTKKGGEVHYSIILNGGASKRMGEVKDHVEFDGTTVLKNVLSRHYEGGIERVFLCGVDDGSLSLLPAESEDENRTEQGFRFLGVGYPMVFQTVSAQTCTNRETGENVVLRNPILGIHDGLLTCAEHKVQGPVFLTSIDVPILDPLLVSTLYENLPENCPGVMAQMADGRAAPLLSLLRAEMLLPAMKAAREQTLEVLKNDGKTKSATGVLLDAGVEVVAADVLKSAGVDLARLEGANTPEELEVLRNRWERIKAEL